MSHEADVSERSGHVIVCGFGHVGHRCVALLGRLGLETVVITADTIAPWQTASPGPAEVILGDARDESLLVQAGIARARAIIVATNDDLANLSIAIDARRLNGKASIVVRMFDQDLAGHLERALDVDRVLSASALSAPVFEAGALGETARGVVTGQQGWCAFHELHVVADSPEVGKPLSGWRCGPEQAIIALERGGRVTFHPNDTTPTEADDRLVVLRFSAVEPLRPRPRDRLGARARSLAGALMLWWRHLPLGLRGVLGVLLGVVVLSIGVFHWALDLPLVDAFYFVVTTITTVGYGDYNLRDASPAMKLFGCMLMICGAAIIASLFSVFADIMISLRLGDALARGRVRSHAHIIVVGLGHLGFRLVEQFVRRGELVVAVESRADGEFNQAARELAAVLVGSTKTAEVFEKAGISTAKAIIVTGPDDLMNLSIGLAAKRANANCRVVLRVFDSALAEKLADGLKIDAVLSMSAAAAPTFVAAALRHNVLQAILVCDRLLAVFSETVDNNSPYLGRRPHDAGDDESIFFVKPVGSAQFSPATNDRPLAEGDEILGAHWYRLARVPR